MHDAKVDAVEIDDLVFLVIHFGRSVEEFGACGAQDGAPCPGPAGEPWAAAPRSISFLGLRLIRFPFVETCTIRIRMGAARTIVWNAAGAPACAILARRGIGRARESV